MKFLIFICLIRENSRKNYSPIQYKCKQELSPLALMQVENRPQLAPTCIKQEPSPLASMQVENRPSTCGPSTCVVTNPRRPKPEEASLQREHFSGIASMSADEFALRNSTVHMQKSPEVLSFSKIVKRIAMKRVRTCRDTSSSMKRVRTCRDASSPNSRFHLIL